MFDAVSPDEETHSDTPRPTVQPERLRARTSRAPTFAIIPISDAIDKLRSSIRTGIQIPSVTICGSPSAIRLLLPTSAGPPRDALLHIGVLVPVRAEPVHGGQSGSQRTLGLVEA